MRRTWPFAAVVFKALWMTFASSPPKPALPKVNRPTDGPFKMDGAAEVELGAGVEPGAEPADDEMDGAALRGLPAAPPPQPQTQLTRTRPERRRGSQTRRSREWLKFG